MQAETKMAPELVDQNLTQTETPSSQRLMNDLEDIIRIRKLQLQELGSSAAGYILDELNYFENAAKELKLDR